MDATDKKKDKSPILVSEANGHHYVVIYHVFTHDIWIITVGITGAPDSVLAWLKKPSRISYQQYYSHIKAAMIA